MRVFVAIEFEDAVKDFLNLIQENMRALCPKGNYTHRENFHLTLRFIGEVEEARLQAIKTAISEAAKGIRSFRLELGGLGHFPKGSRCVAWVGVKVQPELDRLYGALEQALEKQGFTREGRGYNPHITLGREVNRDQAVRAIGTIGTSSITQQVRTISLMESTREAGRLVYKPLFRQEIGS